MREATERDLLQVRLVAAIGAEGEFFDVVVKKLVCSGEHHGGLQTIVIHPLSVKHRLLVPVILGSSSPALSVTHLALVFLLSNIRIEASPVARIDISHSESLIHSVVVCIIEYSPTTRLFLKNIAFPPISLIAEVQDLIGLNFILLFIACPQKSTGLQIEQGNGITPHFHPN